jgi:hypothetical protein
MVGYWMRPTRKKIAIWIVPFVLLLLIGAVSTWWGWVLVSIGERIEGVLDKIAERMRQP